MQRSLNIKRNIHGISVYFVVLISEQYAFTNVILAAILIELFTRSSA
jgi:hypothetical protein